MPQAIKKPNNKNKKYLIIAIALGLAGLGYLGYRSMLTTPEINEINAAHRNRPNSKGAGLQWGGQQNEVQTERVTQPRENTNTRDSSTRTRKSRRGGD